MIFLAICYHYVEDESKYKQGIHPVSTERLKLQLTELGRMFEFVNKKDILNALKNEKTLPEKSCLITFDDGLRCQYEKALPIIDALNVPAIFFVNGLPYEEGKVMLVHKIHWLRAVIEPKKFIEKILYIHEKLFGKKLDMSQIDLSDDTVKEHYMYDNIEEGRVKFLLNRSSLDNYSKTKIIDEIFKEFVKDEKDFCKNFYMTEEQIKELYKRLYLGVHGYSHQPLSFLSQGELKEEFRKMFGVLGKILGTEARIDAISYPYGEPNMISPEVVRMADMNKLKIGFTMERTFNTSLKQPLLFARVGANDVPGGKQPMFKIENSNIVILHQRLKPHRTIYFDEGE